MFKRLLLSALLLATNALALSSNNGGPLANIEAGRAYIRSTKPTLFLDPDYIQSITQDSVGRVSSQAVLYGAINPFTQGTDANKPVLSRPDRIENLIQYSEQLDNAVQTKTRLTVSANSVVNPVDGLTTADTLVENASASTSHYLGVWNSGTFTCVANQQLTLSVYAKRKERDISLRIQDGGTVDKSTYLNLSNCTITATDSGATATVQDLGSGWCKGSITATPTTTAACYPSLHMITAGSSSQNYAGDGASGVYVFGAQLQRSSMQPTYIATTTVPVYGSLTGRRMLTFDGSNDALSSTSKSSDIFGTQAKEAFVVMHTNALNVNQYYFTGFDNYWAMRVPSSGSTIGMLNYDGTTDQANTSAAANTTYVANFYHDTTNIGHRLNNGAFTTTASGASSNLNNVLWIGQTGAAGAYFNGQLGPIITYNRVLTQYERDMIRQILQKFWRVG